MSNYDELVEFRNKLTNDTDYVIFEEDCQMLDNVLDDLEQKDQRIAELESEVEQLKANQNKIAIEKLGELENWINQPYTKSDCYYLNRGATIETTDLQQKIKELKGDK